MPEPALPDHVEWLRSPKGATSDCRRFCTKLEAAGQWHFGDEPGKAILGPPGAVSERKGNRGRGNRTRRSGQDLHSHPEGDLLLTELYFPFRRTEYVSSSSLRAREERWFTNPTKESERL